MARTARSIGGAPCHRADLRLFRIQRAADQTYRHNRIGYRRLEADDRRLDFQYRTRDAGRVSRPVRHMDGTGRARKAIFAAACCFSLGFFVSAFGVRTHNLFLLYLGNGVIGGVGLGLGYVGLGFHADEMVSRQAGYGDRFGDYGFRRRRNAGLAAFRITDERLFKRRFGRGCRNLCRIGACFTSH